MGKTRQARLKKVEPVMPLLSLLFKYITLLSDEWICMFGNEHTITSVVFFAKNAMLEANGDFFRLMCAIKQSVSK